MGSIPLPALDVRPQEDLLSKYGKLANLRSIMQQQQQQAALAPGQQQIQQQNIQQGQQQLQSGALELQMKQLALKNQQISQSTITDPNFQKDFQDWQSSKGQKPSSGVPLHPLAQYLVDRKGLPIMGPGGALDISNQLTQGSQKLAELSKTQGESQKDALDAHSKQLDNFDNLIEPVLAEKDPAKQQDGLQKIQSEIGTHPELYPPEASQHLPALNNIQSLQAAANTSKVRQMLIEDAQKQAGASSAQSEATLKSTAAAKLTPEQINTATNTISTYNSIPQNMRNGLLTEIKNAPNYETLQKVQDRADAMSQSFQRSADARQQALAMKDMATQQVAAGKFVAEDQKLGTALDQTSGIRGLLDMSKGGNEAATSAAQVRFAEHEIVEGGVKRMNQVELNALTKGLGDYGRRFSAWADQGFKGKMPPATNAEMQAILDAEDKSAAAAHDRNIGYIQNRYTSVKGGGAAAQQPQNKTAPSTKSLTMSQIQQAAKDHGVSVDEATRQAKAAGYTINQ